jgi:hypothetical protein
MGVLPSGEHDAVLGAMAGVAIGARQLGHAFINARLSAFGGQAQIVRTQEHAGFDPNRTSLSGGRGYE